MQYGLTTEDIVTAQSAIRKDLGASVQESINLIDMFNGKNLNLHVISTDSFGSLVQTNNIIKQNLRNWINQYKMINDTIDIMDAKIINYGVNFTVVGPIGTNKHDVLRACLDALKQELFLKHLKEKVKKFI